MYATENFKTKKSLKEAVKVGPVACFQPGPFGPAVADGQHCCEGPHYPEAHKWYATVTVRNMKIVKVTR